MSDARRQFLKDLLWDHFQAHYDGSSDMAEQMQAALLDWLLPLPSVAEDLTNRMEAGTVRLAQALLHGGPEVEGERLHWTKCRCGNTHPADQRCEECMDRAARLQQETEDALIAAIEADVPDETREAPDLTEAEQQAVRDALDALELPLTAPGFNDLVAGVARTTGFPDKPVRRYLNDLLFQARSEQETEFFRHSLRLKGNGKKPKPAPEETGEPEGGVTITPEMLAIERGSEAWKALPHRVKILLGKAQSAQQGAGTVPAA